MRWSKWSSAAVVLSIVALSPAVLAQGGAKGGKKPADTKASEDTKAAEEKGADAAGDKADPPAAAAPNPDEGRGADADQKPAPKKAATTEPTADAPSDSPVELPGQTYRFVGARYRGIIIPKFMMNLFGDGGRTVYVHSFGPELALRKDGFEYVFSVWWAGYYMDDTPFKSSSDPIQGWEIVSSKLNVIYLTTDFLWSQELGSQLAVNFGMGAGFGFVFGDLKRTQAYPPGGNGNADPYDWKKCSAQGNPDATFCGTDNDHYDGYTEPSWTNGGSKPIIFPWLVLQTGLRYKPTKQFVGRLDAGFGTSGFFLGLGADYGL
jgi:hypothetical protein